MERGNTKHSPRADETLGPGGSNREEWTAGEPPADDDPQSRTGPPVEELPLDEPERPEDVTGE